MYNEKPIPNTLNLRNFFKTSAVAAAALAATRKTRAAEVWPGPLPSLIHKNDTVLFQGDSITDAGRSRDNATKPNDPAAMGPGYAWLAAAEILVDRPKDNLKFFNRGVSGNKVYQLAERWQEDCLNIKPDVLSILIGVNDIWHGLTGKYNGTLATYEKDYRALLTRTMKALPDVRIVICEPFVLRCGAVSDKWFPEFDRYRATAKHMAEEFRATFVPFQKMFDDAVQFAPPEQWAKDGVHPTPAGAALMAHNWLKAVNRH